MKVKNYLIPIFLILIFLFSSSTNRSIAGSTSEPILISKQAVTPVYFSLIWHQHQPNYQDPTTKIYEQPWVYMHSTNSYPWMADLMINHPKVNATINLTPSLLSQMDDYANGVAYDRRIQVAKMQETAMSAENKSVVLQFFFDINPQFVTGRYAYLQEKANKYPTMAEKIAHFTNGDLLDLKVMFFLRWINPDYIKADFTLATLNNDIETSNSTGRFSHSNLDYVLTKGLDLLKSVVPKHNLAKNQGNLEIITTPFYHPILPLLINLTSARDSPGNGNLPLPKGNTGWVSDANAQIVKAVQYYKTKFGTLPTGMWPSEEAVSNDVVPLMNASGIKWFVSDQTVLQNSLGLSSLTPEQQYQMYKVKATNGTKSYEIASLYRDTALSDKIGFTYSGMDPAKAAQDFYNELKTRYNELQKAPAKTTPYIITVALDGENAWEHYSYDINGDGKNEYTGNIFRNDLYAKLEQAQTEGWLKTVTPTQFINTFGTKNLPVVNKLASGSWISGNLNTWIGEAEENNAWDWLIQTRTDLVNFEKANPTYNTTAAWESIYKAEGSDWFWWYGTDQNSGHDYVFDWGFKSFLRNVYVNIGYTNAQILAINPLLFLEQKPSISSSFPTKMTGYSIDGTKASGEWDGAYFINDTSVEFLAINYMRAGINSNTSNLLYEFDLESSSARSSSNDFMGLYFKNPQDSSGAIFPIGADKTNFSNTLGFQLNYAVTFQFNDSSLRYWKVVNGDWVLQSVVSGGLASYNSVLEMSIPLKFFNYTPGEFFSVRAVYSGFETDIAPQDGPAVFQVPFSGVNFNVVYSTTDPAGDEFGTYPKAPDFAPGHGLFDILDFKLGYDKNNFVASLKFSEITNPWNSPTGFSHPLIQIYIDKNRISGSGNTKPDQNPNVLISPDFAWETLVRADGFKQYGLYQNKTTFAGVSAIADTLEKTITIKAPLNIVGTPTQDWAYVVLIGSQDFSAFRERMTSASTWKLGGGDDGPYDPNVVDMLTPPGVDQTQLLSSYSVVKQQQAVMVGVGPKVSYSLDKTPPVVNILEPKANQAFTMNSSGKLSLTVKFNATDDVKVDHYDLFVGNVLTFNDHSLVSGINSVKLDISSSDVVNGKVSITINVYDSVKETTTNFGTAKVTILISTSSKPAGGGFIPFSTEGILIALFLLPVFQIIKRAKPHKKYL